MNNVLVTGGAGFFGGILKRRLLDLGVRVTSIDLQRDTDVHPNLHAIQGDITQVPQLESCTQPGEKFDVIFHCAAMLAHAVEDKQFLWASNVDGTRNVAEFARRHGIPKLVFISSNCLWAENLGRPVLEGDVPNPVEIYGRSKWEGEKILQQYANDLDCVIIRTPTIIDSGRLGLLAILFEFIDENRKVWVVGGGDNRYQFVYAHDLADACLLSAGHRATTVFNVGSDNVKSLREVYEYVIQKTGSKARVASLPKTPAILAMKLSHHLGISPLGPYQYRMIAEDFMFDTSRIRGTLGWQPKLTNEEMLYRAYEYYHRNRREIESRTDVSAHKQAAKMGVIRLLKWVS